MCVLKANKVEALSVDRYSTLDLAVSWSIVDQMIPVFLLPSFLPNTNSDVVVMLYTIDIRIPALLLWTFHVFCPTLSDSWPSARVEKIGRTNFIPWSSLCVCICTCYNVICHIVFISFPFFSYYYTGNTCTGSYLLCPEFCILFGAIKIVVILEPPLFSIITIGY